MQDPEKKRLLIIEDDPVHRRLMQQELQEQYELNVVADSESALARLATKPPLGYDLVILDLRLPRRLGEQTTTAEGFRVLQALQKECAKIPTVVVISAYMINRYYKQVEEMGVVQVFEKPFSFIELGKFVNELLSTKSY